MLEVMETKYTARRDRYDNTALFKGSRKVDVGWLPDAFARSTQSFLVGAGHKTLRVVSRDTTTIDLPVESYAAWSALWLAAGDNSKFTVIAT